MTPISELSVSNSTVSLTVNSATVGLVPTTAEASGGTYAITTNGTNRKITGSLDAIMPPNVTLSVSLGALSVGSSAGMTALGSTAVDLVTGT